MIYRDKLYRVLMVDLIERSISLRVAALKNRSAFYVEKESTLLLCPQRNVLLDEWNTATLICSKALGRLVALAAVKDSNFSLAMGQFAELRLRSDNAGLALAFHRQEHGC